jgi:photosystem II stability/assembly factor-like uncharacterized protein
MKKSNHLLIITLFLLIFIYSGALNAQWIQQTSPLGTEILGKMQVVSATEGWIACGASGKLLHTTNAGTNWIAVTPFPSDLQMCNPSDIGLTMSWPNATHGWALKTYGSLDNPNGATLYQTANAGADWTKKDFPKLVPSVSYNSSDLTGTWQVHGIYIDNPTDGNVFNGIGFGTTTIAANGSSTSTITNITNSGTQTATRTSTSPGDVSPKGVITISGNDMNGFISSDKNLVILTNTDGGGANNLFVWQKVNSTTVYSLADLQGTWQLHSIQTNANAGWIYGTTIMDAAGNGTTTAFGPNNNQSTRNFSSLLSSNGILTSNGSDMHGFMSADKQTIYITQSQNGGYSLNVMQKIVTNTTYSADDMMGIWQLHAVKIGSTSAAWIRAQYKIGATGITNVTNYTVNNEAMPNGTSSIFISSNGTLSGFGTSTANGFLSADKSLGVNTLTDGSGSYYLALYQKDLTACGDAGMQVQFANNTTGWASVYNSLYGSFKIYKTTNGGTNWDVINGITNPVGGFYYFVDALNGWMFGASASTSGSNTDILHTTDGGLSWTTQATNIGLAKAIYFSDVLHGWLVGRNALLMRTTDGGAHWTKLNNTNQNEESQFRSIYALNANVCYFGSSLSGTSNEYILKTTNGGDSWTPMQVPFQYDMFNVVFWDENNGWISGDYGQIAHFTNNTGIPNIDKPTITIFPNPSSDFISINGVTGTTQVLIYDIAGRILANNQVESNDKLDIRKLNSGIYFLKLPNTDNNTVFRIIKQ